MTQEELQSEIEAILFDHTDSWSTDKSFQGEIMKVINKHVKEVIGEDLNEWDEAHTKVNDEKEEQRKRAGL